MKTVDDYINSFEGPKKEWLTTMVTFMRETFPEVQEIISYQMPTYKFNGKYIAFSVANDHFSFHSLDFEMIEELKDLLPKAKFGKGCAKLKYTAKESIPILFDMCRKIVERSKATDNIKDAFNDIATKYDDQRKKLIPCFEDFYEASVSALNIAAESPEILDIGAGTGLLSAFVLTRFPHARLTLIDISEGMLDVAKTRLKDFADISFIGGDYTAYNFEKQFDFVISALSIHHLTDESKIALFKKCFNLLKPGGIFINSDQVCSSSEYLEPLYKSVWKQSIVNSGLPKAEISAAYGRTQLDKEATLDDQMKWLRNAGFSDVECIYKYFNFAVMFGRKK